MRDTPHTIEVKDVFDFMASDWGRVLFASSSRERKRMWVDVMGNFIVEVDGVEVHKGAQAVAAVDAYNAITERIR